MKAPVGGLLYSLLHLGGFPNDLAFYSGRCGSGRILEMGCGDGRLGVHICLGESPLSVLQQTLRQEADRQTGNAPAQDVGNVLQQQFMPPKAYVGIELCEPLALKAQKRLGAVAEAEVIVGDFLTTLLEKDTASFDTALVSANTLFATPKHGELLAQCANALRPGGVLLLDVYNALPWHPEEGEWQEIGGDEGEADENGEGRDGLDVGDDDYEKEDDDEDEEEAPPLLVRVQDEDGRDWRVYEHEPEVDADAQTITCTYGFKEILGEGGDDAATVDQAGRFTESLVHHYLLPEQLVQCWMSRACHRRHLRRL